MLCTRCEDLEVSIVYDYDLCDECVYAVMDDIETEKFYKELEHDYFVAHAKMMQCS